MRGPVLVLVALGAPVCAVAQEVEDGGGFGLQLTPAIPTGDLVHVAGRGLGFRMCGARKLRFASVELSPGAAFQFLRFEGKDGGSPFLYFGFLPGIELAARLGMVAPFIGAATGLDHFRTSGAFGGTVSASGLGLEILAGADIRMTPAVALNLGLRIHPGYTELHGRSLEFHAFDLGLGVVF